MRMKTFRAATSTAAFAKVKADLGEDAVILSNKTVTEDGCKCCEIVAAVDSTPARTAPARSRDGVIDDALQESVGWQREWSQIRNQLLQLMKPQMDLNTLSPKQKLALEYLEREDVDEKVLAKIYCELRDDGTRSIVPVLDDMVEARSMLEDRPSKFHAFAGPGGAGKTTSLVRLALREKKANPKARICLATADGGRGKGRLVLKHYAELSGLAFREIITRDDFDLLQKEAAQFDVIFLDLPGLPGKTSLKEWTQLYGMSECRDMDIHLVLNPYYSQRQLGRFIEKYKSEQLASVIWTKLDEACTFGAILNMAFASGLPVSALSYGPGLKNSIVPATHEKIWRLLFMRKLPNGDIQP
ncbi:flagellar biosynthesis protein FlhF [Pseudodesulfovibrio cashew]|uniref:Flagellar biosynthesis protein FlhF n=1 Tax=Pseudodesulfovibrio cashew TaxID=2678688 RepID=A0A6I6JIW3_9BACT|nr:flagellar biosynthesis protein FlhF [Pseudodesulfovibrio cashew]QGY41010.1 flagellar biosynthesis protein FlhF [Pseudodesulfovibrio cashew]